MHDACPPCPRLLPIHTIAYRARVLLMLAEKGTPIVITHRSLPRLPSLSFSTHISTSVDVQPRRHTYAISAGILKEQTSLINLLMTLI
jgi:hypothetical protein